ncbi:hypothetical protein FHT86_004529 [Rhizobium sp. BK313]|jgi:hypothetical protein|uniref:DUF2934 domain-containing protein n=1 Tax=Rhizobium sp. BK313 TaxID=2587081 RepID=UPI00106232C5|nr:DUF2934 domain-containing protein [Rhizobium sp. BK313]MBB3456221.1 hypothetical protein [Rhizobium sp. BK313]
MLESRDEWIKKRAYAIWEEEGYPSGRDTVHWEQASSERIALEKSARNGEKIDVTPKAKRKAAAAMAAAVSDTATKRASKKAPNAKI